MVNFNMKVKFFNSSSQFLMLCLPINKLSNEKSTDSVQSAQVFIPKALAGNAEPGSFPTDQLGRPALAGLA